MVAVSAAGTGVTPAEQNLYDIRTQARLAGLDRDQQEAVLSAWGALYALVRSDRDPETETVFRQARDAAAAIPGAGPVLPPPAAGIRWAQRDQWFLALDIDFDAVPVWASLSVPILAET